MNLSYKACCMILLSFLNISCTQSGNCEPVVEPSTILSNMMNWLVYKRDCLDKDIYYSVVDSNCNSIVKALFFQKIINENYMPLKVKTKNLGSQYSLYKIGKSVDSEIVAEIRRTAEQALRFYEMEGDTIPLFRFTDIQDNEHNSINTKGKVVVINCWFISCIPCVKEIPDLNLLSNHFYNRTDVEFIALAFDSKTEIRQFLKKHPFINKDVI